MQATHIHQDITLQLLTQLGPIQATRIRQDITLQLRTQLGPIQATLMDQDIAATRTQLATTPIMELDTTQTLMEPDMFQATRTRQARTLVPTTRIPMFIGQTTMQPTMAIMCPLLPALMDTTRAPVTPITTEH